MNGARDMLCGMRQVNRGCIEESQFIDIERKVLVAWAKGKAILYSND